MTKDWPAPALLGQAVLFPKGTIIARAGSAVQQLHLIEAGAVARFALDRGHVSLRGVRGAGWLIGAPPAITSGWHEETTVALTDSLLRPISLGAFQLVAPTLDVGVWLSAMLAADSTAESACSTAFAKRDAYSRMEALFVELLQGAGRPEADGSMQLGIQLTVTEVAQLAGVTREHAHRVLTDLEHAHRLIRIGGWFVAPASSPITARTRDTLTRLGPIATDGSDRALNPR